MAVLVTGGAGYIGGIAAQQLVEAGEQVVVLDSLVTGHRDAVPNSAVFVEGSTLDRPLLDQVLRDHDIDTVMHFAASIEVGESVRDPGKYFQNNVSGALSVLNAMTQAGVKHFIFSSTAAVYGNPEAVPITEEMAVGPLNPYGLSKLMVEQMLAWFASAHGLRYAILRYFNACGASRERGEAHDPESHLIPNILMAAEGKREHISVFGRDYPTPDGTCVRDYIHVEDLSDAHLKAMSYLRDGGESDVFNLGNNIGNSVLEVIETVKRVTGRDFPVVYADRRPGDSARLVASSDKAQKILNWKPRKGAIATIVEDAWNWRQAYPEGYTQ